MSRLQELIQTIVDSAFSIEILEGTFNDLMVNHAIDEQELIDTLEMNLNDWDKLVEQHGIITRRQGTTATGYPLQVKLHNRWP